MAAMQRWNKSELTVPICAPAGRVEADPAITSRCSPENVVEAKLLLIRSIDATFAVKGFRDTPHKTKRLTAHQNVET